MSDLEPILLADGSKIDPVTGQLIKNRKALSMPTASSAQRMVMATQRKIADLPDVPKTMNTIGVVLSYHLFGMDDHEIAIATGLTEPQVAAIRTRPQFEDMMNTVIAQVMESQTEEVRHLFTQFSRAAVETVAEIMTHGEDEMVKLGAAKDMLDRAGHRPADVVIERRSKSESDLRITFITKQEIAGDSAINITPLEGEIHDLQHNDQAD